MSRIGKKPVELAKGVTASISGQTIEVKGPKGTRTFTATDDVTDKLRATLNGGSPHIAASAKTTLPSKVSASTW